MNIGEYIAVSALLALLSIITAGLFYTEALNSEVKIHCLQLGNPALECAHVAKK